MRRRSERRRRLPASRLAGVGILVAVTTSCTGAQLPWAGPVQFDTAQVWVHAGSDSTALLVEVAETEAQQSVGLSGRSELDPGAGMLFRFGEARPDTAGFWMWRTEIPLDIAFLDREGVILEILGMDPCESRDRDRCPVYTPGVSYWSALEVNRGWFRRHGIEVGARVEVREPEPSGPAGGGSSGKGRRDVLEPR